MRGRYIGESDYLYCIYGREYEIVGNDASLDGYAVKDEVAQFYDIAYIYDKDDFVITDKTPYRKDLSNQFHEVEAAAENEGYYFVRYLRKWRGWDIYELLRVEEGECLETRMNPTLVAFENNAIRHLSEEEYSTFINQYREYFMDPMENFYNLAKEYCEYIQGGLLKSYEIPELMHKLLILYAEAMTLPGWAFYDSDYDPIDVIRPALKLEYESFYMETYDAIHDSELVGKLLEDDLLDIYGDLKCGIIEYKAEQHGNANWNWKFLFNQHWGKHVVDALRALHELRLEWLNCDDTDDEEQK